MQNSLLPVLIKQLACQNGELGGADALAPALSHREREKIRAGRKKGGEQSPLLVGEE
ncbi:hypothetical protein DFQ50_102385 [Pseudocitrobacter faecalis]|uniref:Uncharacterized protein n=1 Tax=Pseudocitrobacter faecalis TaxID=1398493 RepID=A0ABX9G4Y5_9ENTR|nr:hypothetical protein DFQ50_102385 [Pseudocitrobacter faecalis]